MKTTVEYLDAYKAALGLKSDYALAKRWGVVPSMIYTYRRGERTLGAMRAMEVAKVLNLQPAAVIADMEAERAGNAELREVWEQVSEKFSAPFRRLLRPAKVAKSGV